MTQPAKSTGPMPARTLAQQRSDFTAEGAPPPPTKPQTQPVPASQPPGPAQGPRVA